MKAMNLFPVLAIAALISSTGFAQSSETSRHVKITGKVAVQPDCVETGLSIKSKRAEVCLGDNDFGLAVGATYILGGEMTEDGFFPNEFLN